jgi:hypothetical protein
VNNELEGCGRKRPWPDLRYQSRIFAEELRNTAKSFRRVPAELLSGYLSNTNGKAVLVLN